MLTTYPTKQKKTTGVLNRLKHFLPANIKVSLYYSLIQSHINYGILAWGYNNERITKLQKRAIRIISLAKYNAHTEPLFKKMKILQVNDLFKLNQLKFYHKYVNKRLPDYFTSLVLKPNTELYAHNTRNQNNLHRTRVVHEYATKCIRNSIPKLVNTTPNVIIDKISTHSLKGFVNYAKTKYIQNYEDRCLKEHLPTTFANCMPTHLRLSEFCMYINQATH